MIPGIPPADAIPHTETLSRIIREPKSRREVPGLTGMIQEFDDLRKEMCRLDRISRDQRARIIDSLGDAEEGFDDRTRVTFFEIARKGYTVDPGTYRRLHYKQQDGGAP